MLVPVSGVSDSIDERVVDGRCFRNNRRDSFRVWIENVCISKTQCVDKCKQRILRILNIILHAFTAG